MDFSVILYIALQRAPHWFLFKHEETCNRIQNKSIALILNAIEMNDYVYSQIGKSVAADNWSPNCENNHSQF